MMRAAYLLALTSVIFAEVPTEEERQRIVELHAQIRESVEPPARFMMMISYSSELEAMARYWMADCRFNPPNPAALPKSVSLIAKYDKGERPSLYDVFSAFASEQQHYKYVSDQCTGQCYNYKQMVWAPATAFGCAQKQCSNEADSSKHMYLTACLYSPAGIKVQGRPYVSGPSCSDCPRGFVCHRNQCTTQWSSGSPHTSSSITKPCSALGILISLVFVLLFTA